MICIDVNNSLTINSIDLVAGEWEAVVDFGFGQLLIDDVILPEEGFNVICGKWETIVLDHNPQFGFASFPIVVKTYLLFETIPSTWTLVKIRYVLIALTTLKQGEIL